MWVLFYILYESNKIMEEKNYTLSDIQQKSVDRLKTTNSHVIALSVGIMYELYKFVKCK